MNSQKNNYNEFNKELSSLIEEVSSVYKVSSSKNNISYKDFLNNKMLIVHSIRKGISFSFFNKIKNRAPFTEVDWSNFLNISTKSLQRYRSEKNHIFKPIHSEKIIELAEVIVLGNDVFDSNDNFYSWLKTSSIALGSMTPIELLKDSYGKEMVMEELNRIDKGIFI